MSNSMSTTSNVPTKPAKKPLPQVTRTTAIPVEQEDDYIQQVWKTTYSSCLATLLGSRMINADDKFLVRDIHKALELADISREAAKSYIERRKKEIADAERKAAGDPLAKLANTELP